MDYNSEFIDNENRKELEVEVELTMTVRKIVKVLVSDYEVNYSDEDENGYQQCEIDTTNCDFSTAIDEQVDFPDGWEIISDIEYEEIKR